MWIDALVNALSVTNLLIALVGTVLGIVIGALPGIGPMVGMALVLPFTYSMDAAGAVILLGAIYGGGMYGGSIPAILINAPGTGSCIATTFDGYPMAQQGRSAVAMGLAAMASFTGGLLSLVVLALLAGPISRVALAFGAQDYFMLGIFALSVIAVASRGSTLRGLAMGGIGLLLSAVGYGIVSGFVRFSFGIDFLYDGIPIVQVFTGMFALAEMIRLASQGGTIAEGGKVSGSIWEGVVLAVKRPVALIRSSVIGLVLGTLPGLGSAAANLLSYNEAVRESRHPETFGKGEPEGIIASEAANNAVEGGSLIPTFTMGIPGSAASAMFLAALMIHGLQPGFDLFTASGNVVSTSIIGMMIAYVMMLGVAIVGAGVFARVTLVPIYLLAPMVVALTLAGSFVIRDMVGDMAITAAFGIFGYAASRFKFPAVPFVLGLILGPIIEDNYHRALSGSDGSYAIFVTEPISAVFLALTILFLAQPLLAKGWRRVFPKKQEASESA